VPGQCNNMNIFPAMGLAVYATKARRITDEMFIAAARALAEQATPADLETGLIYPPQSAMLKTEVHVANRIAKVIFERGLARVKEPQELGAFIESQIYRAEYRSLV